MPKIDKTKKINVRCKCGRVYSPQLTKNNMCNICAKKLLIGRA